MQRRNSGVMFIAVCDSARLILSIKSIQTNICHRIRFQIFPKYVNIPLLPLVCNDGANGKAFLTYNIYVKNIKPNSTRLQTNGNNGLLRRSCLAMTYCTWYSRHCESP
ncbi:MAG: hypothetical protein FWD66_03350 [Paludibacter sp.]|nr:hypothetical protein [Paludibacter sp.]